MKKWLGDGLIGWACSTVLLYLIDILVVGFYSGWFGFVWYGLLAFIPGFLGGFLGGKYLNFKGSNAVGGMALSIISIVLILSTS